MKHIIHKECILYMNAFKNMGQNYSCQLTYPNKVMSLQVTLISPVHYRNKQFLISKWNGLMTMGLMSLLSYMSSVHFTKPAPHWNVAKNPSMNLNNLKQHTILACSLQISVSSFLFTDLYSPLFPCLVFSSGFYSYVFHCLVPSDILAPNKVKWIQPQTSGDF